jgi:hypothetical protein
MNIQKYPQVQQAASLRVPQFFKPFIEFAGSAYSHASSVDCSPRTIKRLFKDFSEFLRDYFFGFRLLNSELRDRQYEGL